MVLARCCPASQTNPSSTQAEISSEIIRARKKPIIIEAFRLTRSNGLRVAAWANAQHVRSGRWTAFLIIKTLEGNHRADIGDWIIRGVKGEFYPCKPDVFEQTYEVVP